MAFARASGELHSLSTVDIKLIALAHTLEVATHGHANVHSAPPPPRVHSKASVSVKKLPGWGEEGADWDALDQATQDSQQSQGALLDITHHSTMCVPCFRLKVQVNSLNMSTF